MDDTCFMCCLQRLGDLLGNGQGFIQRDRTFADPISQGWPLHQLQHQREYFGTKVFETVIHTNVKLAEAPSHGKTIFEYAPDSRGAEDFHKLAVEVQARAD